ncbi:MAG: deoxyhypusine synthase family protein [Candidatus Micrarchaeota archaeon]
MEKKGEITNFIKTHYKHFNAAALADAAEGYKKLLDSGGKMFISMAGAMSTAELGKSLAEMIRQDKVHAISCTGANLEEDMFNLVAHKHYKRLPNYRDLTPEQEKELFDKRLNRVTDTCIPEENAMTKLDKVMIAAWEKAQKEGKRYFPHEFVYELINSKVLEQYYEIDPKDSWVIAAAEKNLPIFIGGWEDSTLGNSFAAEVYIKKNMDVTKIDRPNGMIPKLTNPHIVKSGIEYMLELIDWYRKESEKHKIGFFQIGGGIAGDFPICVVPLINQDLGFYFKDVKVPAWSYFCQISDSTTSYGSYSGAVPNEKITWGKLDVDTPKYMIESDATIVVPLIFAYVLGW